MRLTSRLMAEHIRLPGCPQIVVTRAYAYQWLKDCGHFPRAHGIGSLDYAVFGAPAVGEPLTNLAVRPVSAFLENVKAEMRAA